METYIKLKRTIDTYNQHWRDGTLKELKTELPQLVDGDKRHSISGVQEKSDGVYIRFFNGLYTRWNKLAPTDEIVFNKSSYMIINT